MPGHALYAPTEGLQTILQGLHGHYVGHQPVALLAVDVHIDGQTVQPVERSRLQGFPGLADLKFAVAHEHPGATAVALEATAQRDASGLRQALAQRSRGHFHARGVLGADHFHGRSIAIEIVQAARVHAAGFDEDRVEHKGVVGRRKKEAILVRQRAPVEFRAGEVSAIAARGDTREGLGPKRPVYRRQIHDLEIQGGENLGRGTSLAHVAAVVLEGVFQHAAPNVPRRQPHLVRPVGFSHRATPENILTTEYLGIRHAPAGKDIIRPNKGAR